MFSIEQALDLCTANIKSRATATKRITYVMYLSNDSKRYERKIMGFTVKQLIGEFRDSHANFRLAFIAKASDDTIVRYFNRDLGKKFYSMSRKKKVS